jgi:predicted double-glycine peptidase
VRLLRLCPVCPARPTLSSVVLLALLCLVSLMALAGCAPSTPLAGPNGASARPAGASKATVRNSPEYAQALHLFRKKDYPGALRGVEALLTTPNLSADDRTFLNRQKDICTAAISGEPYKKSSVASSAEAASGTPAVKTAADADCGPRSLLLACESLGVKTGKGTSITLESLRQEAHTTKDGTTLEGLARAAKRVAGLKAAGVQMDGNALKELAPPAIAWLDGNHYVAVLSIRKDNAVIHDPNTTKEEEITLTTLLSRSGGILLTLKQ